MNRSTLSSIKRKDSLIPLLVIFLWAVNNLLLRMTAGQVEPAVMTFYRWSLAALVLTPFLGYHAFRARKVYKKYWRRLAVLGILGISINQIFAYYAAPHSTATMIGIFGALTPIFIAVASTIFLGEKVTWGTLIGSLCSLFGLLFLVTEGHPSALIDSGVALGEGLLLMGTLAYTGYCVLLRKWIMPLSNWLSLYGQIVFAVLGLFPAYLFARLFLDPPSLTVPVMWAIAYAAIPNSIVAPFLWMKSIAKLGSTRASNFMNLLPVVSAVLAVIFLNEQLLAYHFIGGGLALTGVMLSQRFRRPIMG